MSEKIKEAQQEIWEMAMFISQMNYSQAYKVFGLKYKDMTTVDSERLLTRENVKDIFSSYSYDWLLGKYRKYKESLELNRGDVVIADNGYKGVVFCEDEGNFGTLYTVVFDDGESEFFKRKQLTKTGKTVDLSAFDKLEEEDE